MSLPGDIGEKGEDEETSNDCCPEGEWDWYGEDKDPQPWSHHGKHSAQGEDGSRGTYGCRKGRWGEKDIKDIPQYPPTKVNDEEIPRPNQPRQVASEEVEG